MIILRLARLKALAPILKLDPESEEEEEEEEEGGGGGGDEILVFNDTIEGPRAPAVKPGRITQA